MFQNVPQACTYDTRGLLYFDLVSSKMYRCNGVRWEHWGWGSGGYNYASMLQDDTSTPHTAADRGRETGSFRGLGEGSDSGEKTCPTGMGFIYHHLLPLLLILISPPLSPPPLHAFLNPSPPCLCQFSPIPTLSFPLPPLVFSSSTPSSYSYSFSSTSFSSTSFSSTSFTSSPSSLPSATLHNSRTQTHLPHTWSLHDTFLPVTHWWYKVCARFVVKTSSYFIKGMHI